MSEQFALYTEKIIKELPYWFKMKKDSGNSLGANFLNITGLEFDNIEYVLDYAYKQLRIDTADVDFIDVAYKTILPMNLNTADITAVTSVNGPLDKAKDLAHFFGIDLDGDDPALSRANKYFCDDSRNILYVSDPYDEISFTILGNTYVQPLVLHQIWNFFDEFGLLLDCTRIYGERNLGYKERLLDVFKNPAGAHKQGLLNGIARELALRVNTVWPDAGVDFIITDPMVVLNSIRVNGVIYTQDDVYITQDNTVLLPGDPNYSGETRLVTYIKGIEMHQLHNRDDIKLYNELLNVDGRATDLLKYYAKRIHAAAPIMWGQFKWDESYWDISDKELGGLAFIPNLYDAKIQGFVNYKKP